MLRYIESESRHTTNKENLEKLINELLNFLNLNQMNTFDNLLVSCVLAQGSTIGH